MALIVANTRWNQTLIVETITESDTDIDRWRVSTYRVVGPVFIALCLVAIVANLVVLLAIRFAVSQRPTATLRLTCSLTVSDIWTSFMVAMSIVYNSYMPIVYAFEGNMCASLTLEMIRTGGLITGTLHFLVLACNHYLSIVHPFAYPNLVTSQRTAFCVIVVWLLPPATLIVYASAIPNQGYRNCSNTDFYHTPQFRLSISVLLICLFIAIVLLYFKVLLIVNDLRMKWSLSHRGRSQRLLRQRKTLITTGLICGTFFMGWAPACIHFAITCVGCALSSSTDYVTLTRFKRLVTFSCIQFTCIMVKSIANPVIYAVRIPEIEEQLRSMGARICHVGNPTHLSRHRLLSMRTTDKPTPSNGLISVRLEVKDDHDTVL